MFSRTGLLRTAFSAHSTLLRAASCRVYRSLLTPGGARCRLGIAKRQFTVNSEAGTAASTEVKTDAVLPERDVPRVRVAIECSYGEHMLPRERKSLKKQIEQIYGYNRRTPKPLSLYATGFAKDSASQEAFPPDASWTRWREHMQFVEETAEMTWPRGELVFLTPDARDPLFELKLDRVYVVHGLVDRSVIKNLTLRRGIANGIQCVRLPLREESPVPNMHPILTPLNVISILADVHSGMSWSGAIEKHMLRRKLKHHEAPSNKLPRIHHSSPMKADWKQYT